MKLQSVLKQLLAILFVATSLSSFAQDKVYRDADGNWISHEEFDSYIYWGKYLSPIPSFHDNKKAFKKFYRNYKKNKSEGIQLLKADEDVLQLKMEESLKRLKVENNLGKELPNFIATDLEGNTYNISELKGKVLVFNYWYTGCLPCLTEVPALNRLVKKYQDNKDVVFISFAPDSLDELKEHLKEASFLYPTVQFSEELRLLMKLNAYPTNVVIDRDGKYVFQTNGVGFGCVSFIDKAIQKAL
ncbi:TlpA disulfide reductase family protein [Marinifilum fragile]|uniref:TlpA family protein disulfide reductase n=1 Tax=Marinifilum fragile TaxID=570161 RepID=UPI002AA60E74|nr:TlpA disulfide reductase family protein [Marinifilum fragile]